MSTASDALMPALHHALVHLAANACPHVPNPPGCTKRASVAVILRVRPAFEPMPAGRVSARLRPVQKDQDEREEREDGEGRGKREKREERRESRESRKSRTSRESRESRERQDRKERENDASPSTTLDDFFAQTWVRAGDAEVLLIKRAGRPGDRWSGHVALPGGKRDPSDASDIAAAVRETREEVGLDLDSATCLPAGSLPQRVVATVWGTTPLMVLCPYVFVLTARDVARVQPQPGEVAAAHWVPLRALLSPNLRTREYVDVASRLTDRVGLVVQTLLRFLVGRMVYSAVQLVPSESVYASSIDGFLPGREESRVLDLLLGSLPLPVEAARHRLAFQQPLLLWGLTLGVLTDLLDMLPPYSSIRLWRYPTFSPLDLRFAVWLFTRALRRHNADHLTAGPWPYRRRTSRTASDATTPAPAMTETGPACTSNPQDSVGRLLAGYYSKVNTAIIVFTAYRAVLGCSITYLALRLWQKGRSLR